MYDELVRRLREADEKSMCGECGLNLHTGATKKGVLFAEAADVIEGLSHAVDQMAEWRKNPWIPVTERLPDAGRYLTLTTPFINSGEPFARILRFSENLESVDRYDFEGINRSGWYYYDDEYGSIEVVTVTHWMPLPEPPTAEEGE